MKLIIQIPCLNEREQLAQTLSDLPRHIPGVDTIEVLVIDDGSTDGTGGYAEQLGVHHVIRFRRQRGLAAAFMAGLDAALRLGADIIVNTDADNQYCGADMAALVEPVLAERADMAIGDRRTETVKEFSPLKRLLQRVGSDVVARTSGVTVRDATSGFRAMSREAALVLFVHNRFSYTLETIIQAGMAGLRVENVPVRTNPRTRDSRLFKSVPDYLRRNGPVILRSYCMYRPVQTFSLIGLVFLSVGLVLVGRFLVHYFADPEHSRYVQSLIVGVGAIISAFLAGLMALVGDLIAANRRLSEEILRRLRRLDAAADVDSRGSKAWTDSCRTNGNTVSRTVSSSATFTRSTRPEIPSPNG